MPIPPSPVEANSLTVTAYSIISGAMLEIGAQAPGEQLSPDDSAWGLTKLQRLIDRYNARAPMIYNVDFSRFTLPVNKQPILIGPTVNADFQVNQRPVKIMSATLILTGTSPEVEIPIYVRDDQWWALQEVKNLPSTLPTDLYYSPAWSDPNGLGQLFFWPVATAVNDVRLEMRTILAQLKNYNQNVSLPPGYWDLLINELAIDLAPSFTRPVSPDLRANFMKALKAVQVNNIKSPRGDTSDAGMPGNDVRGGFNYYSGLPSQR